MTAAHWLRIIGADGLVIAERYHGAWSCPFGSDLSEGDAADLDGFVSGTVNAAELGLDGASIEVVAKMESTAGSPEWRTQQRSD